MKATPSSGQFPKVQVCRVVEEVQGCTYLKVEGKKTKN